MNTGADNQTQGEVLRFWFPEGCSLEIAPNAHRDHWFWRMQGGADSEIIARFSDLTAGGAEGNLGHWASEPEGRLALIVVLDQFSRSLWRGSHSAFAQDPAALALAMDGLSNGHYAALPAPWLKIVTACRSVIARGSITSSGPISSSGFARKSLRKPSPSEADIPIVGQAGP